MAVTYASSTLTLTGGTSGTRLTPANIINDATAFSTGSTYAVGAIMKYNAGGGLGTALYRCSTAVTEAGAFNSANWTLLAYVQGTNSIWLETSLVISAAYNDNGWAYSFASGFIYAGNACDWVSGSAVNSSYNIGFTVTYTGAGLASGPNILSGTSGVVNWANIRFICPPSGSRGVGFNSTVMTGSILNCYITNAGNHSIDAPLIIKTNISSIRTNLSVNPVNLFGLVHSGLYEGSFLDNKFGLITATQSGSVVSGTTYAIAALGTATLANWQAFFNTLTAIPAVGNVITATATGTIVGSATAKVYRAMSRYAPDIPADNSRGVSFSRGDSLQFFEDMVVPAGFNFSTQITGFIGGATLHFTRLVNIVAKQDAVLLAGVNVSVVNTSNSSRLSIETTNASGAIKKQMLIFYGERVGGGSYAPLQNTRDFRNKSFLFRRKDLVESVYTADMTVTGVELTQFMSSDTYYTTDQSANLADVSFATSAGAITGMTINAAMTLDRLWDITKAYFEANMGVVNPFSASGKSFNLGSVSVDIADLLSAGAKLDSVTTGTVTLTTQATSTGNYAALGAATIALSGGTNYQSLAATTQITGLPTTGVISAAGELGFGSSTIVSTGNLSISNTALSGTLTISTATARTLTLTSITGSVTVNETGGGSLTVVLAGTTAAGAVTTGAGVTKAVQCSVAVNGGNTFNLVKRYGTTGSYTDLGYTAGITSDSFLVPLGEPVELAMWSLGYLTFIRTIQTTNGGFSLLADMIPEPDVNVGLDVSAYLANISVTYADGAFTATFNADMDVPGIEPAKAILHRLLGLEGTMRALLPPGMSTTVDVEPDEIQINKPAVFLVLGSGATNVNIAGFFNTAPAKLIDSAYIINPRRASDNLRVEIPLVKPALDVAAMAAAVWSAATRTLTSGGGGGGTGGATLAEIEASTVLAKQATLTALATTNQAEHDATQAAIAALPEPPPGLTPTQSEQLRKVAQLHGVGAALVVTETTRTAGDVSQTITTDVDGSTTVSAA